MNASVTRRSALPDRAMVARSDARTRCGRAGALALIVTLAILTTGCEGARRALGFERSSPDEFAVLPREPLTMPPDFGLRPPNPDALGPKQTSPQEVAKQTVFRAAGDVQDPSAEVGGNESRGEAALLTASGASRSDPNIRTTISKDATQLYPSEPSFTDRLIFWRKPEQPGEVVDATAESRRLNENLALNKPATEGDSPSIQRRSKALLENLFDFL